MKNEIITNAIVKSAIIRLDRDCFLSVWLDLKYDNTSDQGFGGYVLGGIPDSKAGQHYNQKNIAGEFIVSCLLVAGVTDWKDIPGKSIRVRRTDEGFGGDIIAIGHIINDVWFEPKKVLAAMNSKHD